MEIKTFGVIGAGQMGNGIAQVAAMSGLNVIMHDIEERFVTKGLDTITANLKKSVEKGKLAPEAMDATLQRIETSVDLNTMAKADFVVEAATENESLKLNISRLGDLFPSHRQRFVRTIQQVFLNLRPVP